MGKDSEKNRENIFSSSEKIIFPELSNPIWTFKFSVLIIFSVNWIKAILIFCQLYNSVVFLLHSSASFM